jgi:hypothetical protein
MTRIGSATLSSGENVQHESKAIAYMQAIEDAFELRPNGGNSQTQIGRNLFVLAAAKNEFNDTCLLRRERQFLCDSPPGAAIAR